MSQAISEGTVRLAKARVQKYRSIKDTDWFEVERAKTLLVGPNEAGKTALLKALEQLNPSEEISGFVALRDYPRSELNDISLGLVKAHDVAVVSGEFTLEDDDKAAVAEIAPELADCSYQYTKYLDNRSTHSLVDAPGLPTFGQMKNDVLRMAAYVDKRMTAEGSDPAFKQRLDELTADWVDSTRIEDDKATGMTRWLDDTLAYISETNQREMDRHAALSSQAAAGNNRTAVLKMLMSRMPVFVYFSAYFRVHPLIHLEHLADRVEQNLMDDDLYDFGNLCLLKLLGFTPRELSDLGKVPEPSAGEETEFASYRDQLDERSYKLNAASIRLTNEIKQVWQPEQEPDAP